MTDLSHWEAAISFTAEEAAALVVGLDPSEPGYRRTKSPLCQTSCRLLFSRRVIRWSDQHEPKTTFLRIQRTSTAQVA
jgi:hypothetical protein